MLEQGSAFKVLLESNYDVAATGRRPPETKPRASQKQLVDKLKYRNRVIRKLKLQAKESAAAKQGLRIANTWKVRTFLADPIIPARQLSSLLSEWNLGSDAETLSHTSVTSVRDAFCEILKTMQAQKLATRFAGHQNDIGDQQCKIFLTHTHDGADCKMRSYEPTLRSSESVIMPIGALKLSRARSSHIENHTMNISFGGFSMPWWSELQPLRRKDAPSLATACIEMMQSILTQVVREVPSGKPVPKIFHILTGDSIPSNIAASRSVLHWFLHCCQYSKDMVYRLICIRCAAHRANLVTVAAICGGAQQNPIRGNAICATVSRLFKYLIPQYCEEYAANLRSWLVERIDAASCTQGDILEPEARPDGAFFCLYGSEVIPPDLRRLLNNSIFEWKHIFTEQQFPMDCLHFRGEVFQLMYRLFLRHEDKPQVTRFWLFASCVCRLTLMKLLRVPASIFTTHTVRPQAQNQKRIQLFQDFYNHPDTGRDLRTAALCLRLTTIAVNIAACALDAGSCPGFSSLGCWACPGFVPWMLGLVPASCPLDAGPFPALVPWMLGRSRLCWVLSRLLVPWMLGRSRLLCLGCWACPGSCSLDAGLVPALCLGCWVFPACFLDAGLLPALCLECCGSQLCSVLFLGSWAVTRLCALHASVGAFSEWWLCAAGPCTVSLSRL